MAKKLKPIHSPAIAAAVESVNYEPTRADYYRQIVIPVTFMGGIWGLYCTAFGGALYALGKWSMSVIAASRRLRLTASLCLVFALYAAGLAGCVTAQGANYRAEYEQLKAAVLAATDATSEAAALRDLGRWFQNRPIGYVLQTESQRGVIGVNVDNLAVGEPVTVQLYAKSDYEPRPGGFTFVPKDKGNLLLLEGSRHGAFE